MKNASWVLAVLLATAAAAFAQPVRVEAVQSPAWLERGGRTVPLAPNTTLQADDRVLTGGNARVRMRMAEGSAVRLGENARFTIERVEDRNVFRAALSVLAGAFRFTTDAALRGRARDVAIKVKHVSVGIRGTDVWGKSVDASDLVCLLEGSVTVGSEGEPAVKLERPNDVYQKPRGGKPEVVSVDARQVEAWSRETAIEGEEAGPDAKGWRIVAAATANRDQALALVRALRAAGFPGEIASSEHYSVVQVANLPNEAQARAVMANLRGLPGVELPKVVPMK